MARPLRIEGAGLWYHVMTRGNAGNAVFLGNADYRAFLNRLAALSEQLDVEVHAYALLNNHVHLFLRTRRANLSRFMQRLLSGHTTWHHRAHQTYGHLFQGRYKALVVQKSAYGAEVTRYIHLNPARTQTSTEKTIAERQAVLRDYRWSSYRAMIGLSAPEGGLIATDTLERFEGSEREQQRAYAAFVEQGLLRNVEDPRQHALAQSVLGHDRFLDRMRRVVQGRKAGDREAARMKRQLLAERFEDVIARVARAYKTDAADLRKARKGRAGHEARQVAIWLTRRLCAGALTARAIGKEMGLSGSAVAVAEARLAARLKRDKGLKRRCERLLFNVK